MPFYYDENEGVWIGSDVTDLNREAINNLFQYGQPYAIDHPRFDHSSYNGTSPLETIIRFGQQDIMFNGYGQNITANDFPIVQDFLDGQFDLPDGSYSFQDLVDRGFATNGNSEHGIRSDRFIDTHLYGLNILERQSGNIATADAAYVHGSVSFGLQPETRFIVEGGTLRVEAQIGAGQDNFDFNSDNILANLVNPLVYVLMGPDTPDIGQQVVIQYSGEGRESVVERVVPIPDDGTPCFPCDTPILLADGSSKAIADVRVGDMVMAFDGFTALQPRRVVNLFRNATDEWLELTFDDGREALTVTPGHRFLTKDGDFAKIKDLITNDNTAEIVLADGSVTVAQVKRVVFGVETADLYEQAYSIAAVGNTALKPQPTQAWQTYNFEVEELHTYVAGGVRVHNDCAFYLYTPTNAASAFQQNFFNNDVALEAYQNGFQTLSHNGQAFGVVVDRNATMTHSDGTTSTLTDYVDMFQERAEFVVDQIGLAVEAIPGYLGQYAPNIIADLANGADIADVAEQYATVIAINIGADRLSEIFGLSATQIGVDANGVPIFDGVGFFDTQAGQSLKSGIVQLGVTIALSGSQMDSGDYARVAANISVREVINYAFRSYAGEWAVNEGIRGYVAGGSGAIPSFNITPAGAGAIAAAASFASNLIDHGFEDFGDTLAEAAFAGAVAYASSAAATAVVSALALPAAFIPGLNILFGVGVGLFGSSLFGGDLPPAPDLVHITTHDDGTQTIQVASYLNGYGLAADAGSDDDLVGGAQSDNLLGSDGNNSLYGQGGNDHLDGKAGNDVLVGGDGDDVAIGGHGDDVLIGGAGSDQLYGDGRITLTASGVVDTEPDANGKDLIQGGAGNDEIYGGAGDDVLRGENDIDFIYGGTGNDLIEGGNHDDLVLGEDGNDILYGDVLVIADDDISFSMAGNGNDTIEGGAGDDQIYGGAGNDYILGGAGADIIYGDGMAYDASNPDAPVITLTGTGNDTIYAEDGDDFVQAGAGNDLVHGGIGNDQLNGGDGSDVLYGEDGDDALNGETGDDQLFGHAGNDRLSGGEGNDNLNGGTGDDHLDGGDGHDELYAGDGNDALFGGIGNDVLHGQNGNDALSGEIGADYLNGGDGNDVLSGGSGDDVLLGAAGADTLDGGDGNDDLSGGGGDDDLAGGAGNDSLRGEYGRDILSGGNGNDSLYGNQNDDTLSGGNGDDIIDGGAGNDTMSGDSGNDILYGLGFDVMDGGEGNDTYQLDFMNGSYRVIDAQGIDMIRFSDNVEVQDIVMSKDGNDLMILHRTLTGPAIRVVDQFLSTGTVIEAIEFSDGFTLNISNMIVGDDGDNILEGTENADGILGLGGNDSILGRGGNDYLDGGDGEDVIYGGTGQDIVIGSGEDDLLSGDQGNDTIIDGLGSDILIGGSGSDSFYITPEANSIDTITDFTKGEDKVDLSGFEYATFRHLLYFGDGMEQSGSDTHIFFSSQKVALSNVNKGSLSSQDFIFNLTDVSGTQGTDGNDRIRGTSADAVISDGAGSDLIIGGTGQETFVFTAGYANVDLVVFFDLTKDVLDISSIADTISFSQLDISQRGNDTILSFANEQHIILDNTQASDLSADHFRFNTFKDLTNQVTRYSDTIGWDFAQDNTVENNSAALPAGITSLPSFASTLIAAASPESFALYNSFIINYGGQYSGSGVFEHHFGLSGDTIYDFTPDAVLFNNEYWVEAGGKNKYWDLRHDTHISGAGGNDAIYGGTWDEVVNGFSGHDLIEANDGNDILWGNLGNDDLGGGAGNDFLYGEWGLDLLRGGSGNDYLNGGDDNDLLYGESGNDHLEGQNGDDYLAGGSGSDYLIGGEGRDVLDGEDHQDILLGGGDDDLIRGAGGDDYVFAGWGNDDINGGIGNDYIQGEDGNDIINGGEGRDSIYGNNGNDRLLGWIGNDVLSGGAGNDYLDGNQNDDLLFGQDGTDILIGGEGNDRLYGGNQNDDLFGSDGADFLSGGHGDDNMFGQNGNDILHGDAGNDRLNGDDGDDILNGYTGNDTLLGGSGNDQLNGGTGADIISGGSGNDVITGEEYANQVSTHQTMEVAVEQPITFNTAFYSNVTITTTIVQQQTTSLGFTEYGAGDTLYGNEGDDIIFGYDGADYIDGGSDNDRLYGGGDNDYIIASTGMDYLEGNYGHDVLIGTAGQNWIHGGGGVDIILGGTGNEILYGGSGSDMISGGDGSDHIFGGTNDDLLAGDGGHDYIVGGDGNDAISGGLGDDLLEGGNGTDTLDGNDGKDFLSGGAGNDVLRGGKHNDILMGDAGADVLQGGSGMDQLDGGSGDDIIIGGESADILTGGDGADTFVFNALVDSFANNTLSRVDVITDFNTAFDKIDLTAFSVAFGNILIEENESTRISLLTNDFEVELTGINHGLNAEHFIL